MDLNQTGATSNGSESRTGHASTLEVYRVAGHSGGVQVDNAVTSRKASAFEDIEAFAELQPDWDGYGGLSISPATRANAIHAVASFPPGLPMPDISPNSNGTISFDWTSVAGCAYLEIGKTRFSFYIKVPQREPMLADGFADAVQNLGQAVLRCLYAPPVDSISFVVVAVDRTGYATRR